MSERGEPGGGEMVICPQCGGRYSSYPYPCRAMCMLCDRGKVAAAVAEEYRLAMRPRHIYQSYDGTIHIEERALAGGAGAEEGEG